MFSRDDACIDLLPFLLHSAHEAQLAGLRPFRRDDAILGKIVDVANPSLEALDEIAAAAAMTAAPRNLQDRHARPGHISNSMAASIPYRQPSASLSRSSSAVGRSGCST